MLCVFQISPSISLIMGRVCVCNIKIHIKCNEKEARGEFHLGQEIDGIFAVLKRRFGKTTVRCYYQARYMCRKILNSLQIWKVEFHLIEQKRAIIQSRSMNYTKYVWELMVSGQRHGGPVHHWKPLLQLKNGRQ